MSDGYGESGQDPWRSEDDEPPSKRFHGSTPLTFKFLAPRGLVSLIKTNAKAIEDIAGGSVTITEPDDHYPNTNLQIGTLQATMDGDMVSAMRRILLYVSECGECIAENGAELRFTVVMPSKSVSALIGVKGANVQVLQHATGCHIHVDGVALGFGPGGDRAVHINGGPSSLEKAIGRAVDCVKEFQDTPWFPKWAARTNAERLAATEAPPLPNTDPDGTSLKGVKNGTDGLGASGVVSMPGIPNVSGIPMGLMSGLGGMNLMGGMGFMGGMGVMPSTSGMPGIPGMCGTHAMTGMPAVKGAMGVVCGTDGISMSGSMASGPTLGASKASGMGTSVSTSGGAGCGASNTSNLLALPGIPGQWGGDCSTEERTEQTRGAEIVMKATRELPPSVANDSRGFLLRCAIPGVMAEKLIANLKEVQDQTGTKITIPSNPDSAARMLAIEGPLLSACAAYMLMMRRYIEAEQEM